MLVLSRRKSESIVIGDDIVVTIVRIRGNQVHPAFDAPQETPIYRHEIYRDTNRSTAGEEVDVDVNGCQRSAVPSC